MHKSVEKFVSKLQYIDKLYSGNIAKKKKDDLRKLIYTSTDEDRKAAFETAWKQHHNS